MATTAFPLDALSGAPTYYAQSIRQAFSAFLGTAPAGRPLGATSGVRPGTPSNTVTVSGFTWACAAHSGVMDVQASAVAGPYLYATDGNDTSSITAADATNPRVDIVFVQVNDSVQDGSGAESASVGYLAGTPASTPAAPAAPARSLVIAQISVPKAGGGNPTVSWVAPVWGTQSWTSYTPTWTGTIGNGTMTGSYLYDPVKGLCYVKVRMTMGSTSSYPSAPWAWGLPLTPKQDDSVGTGYALHTTGTHAGGTLWTEGGLLHAYMISGQVTSTNPFTWAAGDTLFLSATYQV